MPTYTEAKQTDSKRRVNHALIATFEFVASAARGETERGGGRGIANRPRAEMASPSQRTERDFSFALSRFFMHRQNVMPRSEFSQLALFREKSGGN